jgi:arylformamidase
VDHPLLDVTVPLVPGFVPLYPRDTELQVGLHQSRASGDPSNVSRLVCSTHCGTHVDAPAHFMEGAAGIETVPLDALIGPALVVDATGVTGHIDAAALAALQPPLGTERVLFRTSNSRLWDRPRFTEDFVAMTPAAARALVDRGVRLVGIDYLSIAPYDDPAPTHEVLLRAGVVIVETLDLRAAAPGEYQLICLPLLVPGADGAPARALLAPSVTAGGERVHGG